jgi:ankyrin repeat protein
VLFADRWGNTPLDEAETFEHEKIAEFLKSYEEKVKSNGKENSSTISAPSDFPLTEMVTKLFILFPLTEHGLTRFFLTH